MKGVRGWEKRGLRGPGEEEQGGDCTESWPSRCFCTSRLPSAEPDPASSPRGLCAYPRPTEPILVTGLISPDETVHDCRLASAHKELQRRPGLAVCSRLRSRCEQREPRARWLEGGASHRAGRQLGLKQWPVKCQKCRGKAVVEQRGDHERMGPRALETIPACSHRRLWQS